jgi:dihydroorotate dehydrogenase
MSWLYGRVLRPVLFSHDAERIHERSLRWLSHTSSSRVLCGSLATFFSAPALPVELFGLKFPNPVGLAAGLDKYAEALPVWASLGFGFTELGGVTWHRQPGNDQPRLFRVVEDEAIVNRMGFNNPGAEAMAEKLAAWRKAGRWPKHPVGINLGKSKVTPLESAAEDYANSFRALKPYADFVVVNVSSPNTPNLRKLQEKSALDEVLIAVQSVAQMTSSEPQGSIQTPVLVKVAPDLSFEALDEILDLVEGRKVAGIVATNTTLARPDSSNPVYQESGGLSGRPLRERSTEVIRHLYKQGKGRVPIIGVGGIFDAVDAWEKITAGASLLQVYTGLIYRGPGLARSIVSGIVQRMNREGFENLKLAVGTNV